MKIKYSNLSKQQLQHIKKFISKDSKKRVISHLTNIKEKLEILQDFPYLGKINDVKNDEKIRDYSILGYKVIYKINEDSILILAIYKYIDFEEEEL